MPHQMDRLTWKSLIFLHAVVFLLLTHCHEGHCQDNSQSSELMGALLGENITLPCHVSPAKDAVNTLLEWTRPDLEPRFVLVRRDGEERLFDQHSSYKGRTSVSIDGLRRGDVSLKLSKVTFSDEGTYRCFVPGFEKDTSIKLVVDVFIKITNITRGVLQCKSTGWYPEPEVFWLDGEGNLLSAGPTETVRGPDDLYTVSSRVTVEKRHSNNFTCRVQQNHINQTRETKIHVPDDFFKEPSGSGSSAAAIIFALIGVTVVLAGCFFVWKRKQMRNNSQTYDVKEEKEGSEASEQEHLIEAAEGEPLKNQSKVDEGINSKYEQTGRSDQIEEKQSEKFRMEAEENVGTGSQCVMENERQQHEIQTTEELNNTEKESKSVSEGSSDQVETETLREKTEKSEDTGDQKEGTKSETEGQGLMEGGQQQVAAGGEEKTDPHKEENKWPTQTGSAGQSPADGDKLPAEGTNPGMEETREGTKSVSEGSSDQEEAETPREKTEKSEDTGDREEGTKSEAEGQGRMEIGQQPVGVGGEEKTDPHKVENKKPTQTGSADQSPADGAIQEDQPPAGEGTHVGLEEKTEETKAEDGGGGDKTSTEENATPQSPVDEQTGQLKDTDSHKSVDQNDKNKEAEKSTDIVTAGQRQTAAQTQHEDKTDEERQYDKDTESERDTTQSPSSVNPKTKTGQQTGEESESPESRDGDKKNTSGGDATTQDQNSAEDGDSGEEKKKMVSHRENSSKNGGDDTDASGNNSGSQSGSDREQELEDKGKESDDGASVQC